MRIISGKWRGIRLQAPTNLPVRPTTDQAKEALFNILINSFDFDGLKILDLFSGTGNMSYEFVSRGCTDITCVDKHLNCVRFIKETFQKLKFVNTNLIVDDVFKFLKLEQIKYDIIFADPPYDMPRIAEIADLVMEQDLLNTAGVLIIEHASLQNISNGKGYQETRTYGSTSFSFFKLLA